MAEEVPKRFVLFVASFTTVSLLSIILVRVDYYQYSRQMILCKILVKGKFVMDPKWKMPPFIYVAVKRKREIREVVGLAAAQLQEQRLMVGTV